ncbi:hypothetical protein BH24ACT3_BH24ACT3_06880 [soil metagenome]
MTPVNANLALRNVRAVLADRILDDATVLVGPDGRIEAVTSGGATPSGAIDGGGSFCLPGLIDTHSDGLEKELRPRANVVLPVDFALRSFEGRLRSSGVTTVFHGVGFEDKPAYDRTIDQAHDFCTVIAERRRPGTAPTEHRVLHRVEARSPGGLAAALARLPESEEPLAGSVAAAPLVSFEDHTPGQGQFRNIEKFRHSVAEERRPPGVDVDTFVQRAIDDAETRSALREEHIAGIGALARSGRIRLLGHDLEDAVQVAEANEVWRASVAEFPLSLGAAAEARDRAMPVVMGAPNVLRGGSHSGNIAAADMVGRGLCDVLASDYQPSTLLAAVFVLAAEGVTSLPAAVGLVTSGPATMAGLTDRGRLAPGCRADLVLVDLDGRWPRAGDVAGDRAGPGRRRGLTGGGAAAPVAVPAQAGSTVPPLDAATPPSPSPVGSIAELYDIVQDRTIPTRGQPQRQRSSHPAPGAARSGHRRRGDNHHAPRPAGSGGRPPRHPPEPSGRIGPP